MRRLSLMAMLVCSALWACHDGSAPAPRVLHVTVRDDGGRTMPMVPVEVDGVRAALTDPHGLARATLQPGAQGRLRVSATCPEGYRKPAPRVVPVQGVGAVPLSLELLCRPVQRTIALVVRAANGEGLLVRADGHSLGRIGRDGTLHAVLKRAPESDVRLVIDTESDKRLSPQHPVRDVRISDRDELVVFDQAFVHVPARPRIRRSTSLSPTPKPAPQHVPYALGRGPRS